METQFLNHNLDIEIKKTAYIVAMNKSQEVYPIEGFFNIGRAASNNLCTQDPFSSQRHARIEKKADRYLLTDLRSRNGTFLNGISIVQSWLRPSDLIRIGESEYLFSVEQDCVNAPKSKNYSWNKQLLKIPTFAKTDLSVLIIGPSGTGKELIARQIHDFSERKEKPYVTINCSALSENLIESELFGHIKGSFTGATEDRKGAFESARGGTLFLDEIGDLPISLQPKLLRALENKEIRPVGSDKTVSIDVRIVAATHKNLYEKCLNGEFREDLYHRLNVCRITPPPLIERMEDFETLIFQFAKERRVSLSNEAIEKLKNHCWPGNIRELKNTVCRASAYFSNKKILPEHIDELIDKPEAKKQELSFAEANLSTFKVIERDLILDKLQRYEGNQSRVAEDLKIPKSTLHDRLKMFGINAKIFKKRRFTV